MSLLVIPVLLGLAGGVVGRVKGSSFWLWFVISLCLPGLGLIAALLYRWDTRELRRQCPGCGRIVKLHDALCVVCGTELDFPEVAIAPEASAPTLRVRRERDTVL